MYPKRIAADHRELQNALTVAELIEYLQDMPEDARVMFTCDYGDYCHTQQLLPVASVGLPQESDWVIRESAYSQSGLAIEPVAEDEFDESDSEDYTPSSESDDETGEGMVVVLNLKQ